MQTLVRQVNPAKLKEARNNAKLTQEEIGVDLGIGKAMIAHLESGYAEISGNQLARWAQLCGVDDIDFFYAHALPGTFYRRKSTRKKFN